MFVDNRLAPWRYNVPEAGSTYSRVQATIAFLYDKANTQGQNALVLLLQALQDRYDPNDAYFGDLGVLIAALGGAPVAPSTHKPRTTSSSSASGIVDYEVGLRNLLVRLGTAHPRYNEALVYQQRLSENLTNSRLYGDTETRRAERAEIIARLNELSLSTLGRAFNDLAGMATTQAVTTIDTGGGAYVGGNVTTGRDFVGRDHITIIGDGNVIGNNNRMSVDKAGTALPGETPVPGANLPDRTYAMRLFNLLTQYFSLDELNTLCFAVGVNYDELPGAGLSGKARELLSYCERHACLPALVEAGKTLRPELEWA